MSQQEFVPGSQSQDQQPVNEDEEIYYPQYPYHWSGKLNKEGGPRDEPPSSYDAAMMQQGYQAQDTISSTSRGSTANASGQQPQQGQQAASRYQSNASDSDGDAYEQGYGPYNSYNARRSNTGQGVPPWARPQQQQRNPLRFGYIILILILIGFLQGIFGHGGFFIGAIGDIFGLIIGAILLPIVLLLVLFLIFARIVRRAFWPGRWYGRRQGRYWYRRGPWWF